MAHGNDYIIQTDLAKPQGHGYWFRCWPHEFFREGMTWAEVAALEREHVGELRIMRPYQYGDGSWSGPRDDSGRLIARPSAEAAALLESVGE